MSRTPEYRIDKLPKWVQNEIHKRDETIARQVFEEERLLDVIKQLEEVNEELAKNGEANALSALAEASREVTEQQDAFSLRRVDL